MQNKVKKYPIFRKNCDKIKLSDEIEYKHGILTINSQKLNDEQISIIDDFDEDIDQIIAPNLLYIHKFSHFKYYFLQKLHIPNATTIISNTDLLSIK